MKSIFWLGIVVIFGACSTAPREQYSDEWKKKSDALSTEFLLSIGEYKPEEMSFIGFSKFDSLTIPYSRDYDNKRNVLAYKWKQKFLRALEGEKNPELITDLNLLINKADSIMQEIELDKKLGVIPFFGLTEFIYMNLLPLVNTSNGTNAKMNSALARFREYVRGDNKGMPVIDSYMAYLLGKLEYIESKSKRGLWPSRLEVENYIKNSDSYIKGIENLLSKAPNDDWKRDLKELVERDVAYREFLKKKIYPYCRKETQINQKYYAWLLKSYGVKSSPDQLIEKGLRDFSLTYKKFKKLAAKIAKSKNLSSPDPLVVLDFLKSKKAGTNEELLEMYKAVDSYLNNIVKVKKLITVKKQIDYQVRIASSQELSRYPSPLFVSSPYFAKNYFSPQYVIPSLNGEKVSEDYAFREAIVSLTAHEAVPGHALQFQSLKNRDITIARGILSAESASIEGWGLYAEGVVYPYLTDEEKFVIIQRRLWRQARMFLDPQLALGSINKERVIEVFTQIGFSKEFAEAEYIRYSFLSPAQATSYYYGYKTLIETKKKVSAKVDTILDERCFNDAVLDQGMMPLNLLSDRLMKNLNCVEQ